jgi:hypothetical protein
MRDEKVMEGRWRIVEEKRKGGKGERRSFAGVRR